MRYIALALALVASQAAAQSRYTIRVEDNRSPLPKAVCDPRGWPNPVERFTVPEAKAQGISLLVTLMSCGHIDSFRFAEQAIRINNTNFEKERQQGENYWRFQLDTKFAVLITYF